MSVASFVSIVSDDFFRFDALDRRLPLRRFPILLLGCLAGCVTIAQHMYPEQAAAGRVEVSYDRFRGTQTWIMRSMLLGDTVIVTDGSKGTELRLGVIATLPVDSARRVTAPGSLTLRFTAISRDWRYLKRDREVTFILDRKDRIRFAEPTYDGDVGDGVVTEYLDLDISGATLQRIASSALVEGQVGSREFTLRPPEIQRLASFADSLPRAAVFVRPDLH